MFNQIRFSALPFIACCITFVMATACHTAQKYVESGDYDDAINLCVRKLQGKKKKKIEYVQGLEIAFEKAQARDMKLAERLAAEGRPENWEKINAIHRDIRDRQAKVEPLIPLRASNGHAARFLFVRIDQLESESRKKAADYLYDHAIGLLQKGKNGDKIAARDAYYTLIDLENRYYRNYKESDILKKDARRFGTSYVLFDVKNQSDKVLPKGFAERVLAMSKADLDSEWKSFYFDPKPGMEFDYKVVFKVRKVDISPERINERSYTDEKTIEDGWEYVLDAKGNVKKDTLGNDIKQKRYAIVRANVIESLQTKAARLSGIVEVYNADKNTLLDTHELGTEVLFENYAATFVGDQRALSDATRCHIGNRPKPFPYDEDMLVQAADRLKPDIRDELRRNRAIL